MIRICIFLVLSIFLYSAVFAGECDVKDPEFPEDDCSFTDLGINIKALRFGKIDTAPNSSEITFGSASYDVSDAEIYDTDDSDCNFDDEILDDSNEGDEVAFTVSINDPRKIEQLWLLDDCSLTQAK